MDKLLVRQRALALWNEAKQYQLEGQLTRAIRLYTESIHTFPTAEAHTYLGWAYSCLHRMEDAIDECKKAIAIDSNFGNPYNDIGSYLIAMGRVEESIEWFEKAKKAPRYESKHFPFVNLGRVYSTKGMLKRAIREFESALKHYPGEPTCVAALQDLSRKLN